MSFPKISTRIRNRMEKWTAFTLASIAVIWFNNRLNKVESAYTKCMDARVQDAKQATIKSTYNHEKKKPGESAYTKVLPQITEFNVNDRSNGREHPITSVFIASIDSDHRRVRGSRWGGGRFRFPTD